METHSKTYVNAITSHYDQSYRNVNDQCHRIKGTLHEIASSRGHLNTKVNNLYSQNIITIDVIEDNVNIVHLVLERRQRLLLRHMHVDVNEERQMIARMKAELMSRIQTLQ